MKDQEEDLLVKPKVKKREKKEEASVLIWGKTERILVFLSLFLTTLISGVLYFLSKK